MTKKTTFMVALLFAFTLALTLAITVSAEVTYPPTCCNYYISANCWIGGNIDNGTCQPAEPLIPYYHDGLVEFVDNPCFLGYNIIKCN